MVNLSVNWKPAMKRAWLATIYFNPTSLSHLYSFQYYSSVHFNKLEKQVYWSQDSCMIIMRGIMFLKKHFSRVSQLWGNFRSKHVERCITFMFLWFSYVVSLHPYCIYSNLMLFQTQGVSQPLLYNLQTTVCLIFW